MKRSLIVAALAALTSTHAVAQHPPADSARPMMRDRMMMSRQGPAPEALRVQIEERWGRMVQVELGLSDAMMDRLRAAERANQDRHLALTRREEDLRRVVQDQLQPGVAANAEQLSRALDDLAGIRVQHAQSDQQLLRDLSFLAPVQRARYVMMARRFRERIEDIRERRPMMQRDREPGPGRPGAMPRRPMQDDDEH